MSFEELAPSSSLFCPLDERTGLVSSRLGDFSSSDEE